MNVQILVLPDGRLVWASDPYPGSMHDVAALDASGLLEGIDPSGWIADKGYIGRGMITPHKKPPNGELSEAAKKANKSINKIRQVVERTIAHIKSWRIHPHRLPPPPAHIRADHHRRTLTPRIQNHPLNNLQPAPPRAPGKGVAGQMVTTAGVRPAGRTCENVHQGHVLASRPADSGTLGPVVVVADRSAGPALEHLR